LVELTYVFVKPKCRRRGIGSQLVKLAVQKAEKEGIPLSTGVEEVRVPCYTVVDVDMIYPDKLFKQN